MAEGKKRIDHLRAADGSLDRQAIRRVLPYGDDFLFVDRVVRLEERKIEALFQVPHSAPYLDAHFRGLPIVPGAILSEAFAQAGSILVRSHLDAVDDIDIIGHHVESARFLSLALPGEALRFHVRLVTMNARAARLEGEAYAEKRKVGRMRVVVAIVSRQALLHKVAEIRGTSDA